MTVRTWFRQQRGATWDRGDLFWGDLNAVTALVVDRRLVPDRLRVGNVWWIGISPRARHDQILREIAAAESGAIRLSKADITR